MPEQGDADTQGNAAPKALTLWWPEAGDWFSALYQDDSAASRSDALKKLDRAWPNGRRLLARANHYRSQKTGLAAQASYLFHQPQTLAEAPVLAHLLADASSLLAQNPFWVIVSPVQLVPDRDTLRLFPPENLAIQPQEAEALFEAFNQHFKADGVRLHWLSPTLWLLGMPQAISLQTTPLAQAANQSVDAILPTGNAASHWHSLMNEAQMLFHQQAVNEQRREAGQPEINGIWLWGEGTLGEVRSRPEAAIAGESLYLKALADLSNSQWLPPCKTYQAWWKRAQTHPPCRHTLIHLSDALPELGSLTDPAQGHSVWQSLETDWFVPIANALKSGALDSVFIDLGTLGRFYLTPGSARRFWRFRRSLRHWYAL
ncbi:MAG: hypothetical protein RI556_00635 [Hydrogenovibrio sp.]|uniref:hypothetical protein n=1 Tax=Hydrogenovibrio sp. TaxID=2065821 RepID=UPI00287000F2|nr:hypothetical protein [Hydrogenovibrio sp.]MDR9497661.1 hypothetical protein [Hydrogenovibrio sp.]